MAGDDFLVPWVPGDQIGASRLNLLQAAIAATMRGGNGIAINTFGNRVTIGLERERANPFTFQVKRFRVKTVSSDHLICRAWQPDADPPNGVEGSVDILIAKPFELRRTPFDGQTITFPGGQAITYTYDSVLPESKRSATDGTDAETQVMTPAYFVDTEILAGLSIDGGVGVEVNSVQLVWEDMNTAGRFWAKES